jgi:drug/metabolite transporter (DMT)-like permease
MSQKPETSAASQRAILATLAATAAFTVSDTLMKLSSSDLPAGQTIALRGVFGTIAMTVLVFWTKRLLPGDSRQAFGPEHKIGGKRVGRPNTWVPSVRVGTRAREMGALRFDRRQLSSALILRTLCEVGSSIFFFLALYRMPIANAMAILQFLPLALTAASAIVLREVVGWRRWLATAIGLAGVLLIVRPGSGAYGWPSLLMLACVGCITVRDLATRRIPAAVPSMSIGWLTAVAVMCGGVLLDPPWHWVSPTPHVWGFLAAAALVTVAGNLLMIVSTRTAAVAVVAPFRYATVVFAILAGYLVWSEVPDSQTMTGILIVIGAGLYTFHREHVRRDETVT